MSFKRNLLQKTSVYLSLVVVFLTACVSSPGVTFSPTSRVGVVTETLLPSATFTPIPMQTETPTLVSTSDIWDIQKCPKAPNDLEMDYDWVWKYTGDVEGRGEVDMLLNFTANNEIVGFAFDFDQLIEYRVTGCVKGRLLIMWLLQKDSVKAVIRGEFPKTDPRGHYSASTELSFDVITGLLIEKGNSENFPTYLHLISGTVGTMDHRFERAGAYVDKVILNASQEFLAAIANDDRAKVVEMLRFPVLCNIRGEEKMMETSELFLANYDDIFGDGFKERLAITFPNYLEVEAGLFVGMISQSIYGGGAISFDEHGMVTAIYNGQESMTTKQASCYSPTKIPNSSLDSTLCQTSIPTPIPIPTSTTKEMGPCSTNHQGPTLILNHDRKDGWCELDHPLDETAERYGYRLTYPDRWSVRLAGVLNPNLMFNDDSTSGDKPEVFLLWVDSALPLSQADQAMSPGYELIPPRPLIDPLESRLQKEIVTIGDKQVLVVDTQIEMIRKKYFFFFLEAGKMPDAARFLFMVQVKVDRSEVSSDAFLHSLDDMNSLVRSVDFYRKD